MSELLPQQPAPDPAPGLVRLQPGDSAALDTQSAIVGEGRVEIYLLLGNRRRFIAEMPPGAVLFAGVVGLLAVAPEGATLKHFDVQRLAATAADALQAALIVPQIDAWVDALSEGIARLSSVRPHLRGVSAGDPLAAEPEDITVQSEAIAAAGGVVWITAAESTLHYMGLEAASCGPLPVTSSAWLLRQPQVAASASSTSEVLSGTTLASLLAHFHWHAARAAAESVAQAEAAETARIAEREAKTEREIDDATRRLGQVLDERAPRFASDRDDNGFVLGRLAPGITIPARGKSLRAAAESVGVNVRSIMLDDGWWRRDHGRLAGRRITDGRPVALIADWLGRYRMHVRGEPVRSVNAALAAQVERDALALLPPLPNRPIRNWEVAVLGLMLCRADLVTLTIAGLAASLLGLAMPIGMGVLIDNFVPDQLHSPTVLLGVALAMLTLCNGLLHAASDLARLRIDGKLSTQLQAGVIDRILRLPSRLLRAYPSADLSLRVLSIEQMRHAITSVGLNTVIGGLFGVSNLVVLAFYDLTAGVLTAVLFVVLVAAAVAAGLTQLRALAVGEQMTANIISQTLQFIQNVATLRAFGAESRAFINWARNTAAFRGRMLRSRRVGILFECFLAGYDILALAAIFALLGFFAGASAGLTIGAYLAFVGIYESFLFTSEGLARGVIQVLAMQPMMKRAALILETAPETAPTAVDPGPLAGAVEVSALTFSYGPDRSAVLTDVSFKIEPGQFVAIVGPSGSGKSTLMNLILGFDQPKSGTVLFDGKELSRLNRTAVRRQIGIVRQNGRLLAGSIYDNILGLHPGTLEDAWEAAELAGIADDIRALPMGMHTVLNEGMPTFSGGQIQRLLIARGLAGKPRILMLDEATSALDNRTQADISYNIERLGVTRIVVAHRLSTVRNADVIHYFEAGRLVESGTFDSLIQSDGRFASFTRRQVL